MSKLLDWDYNIFYWLHVQAHCKALDFILPYIRNQYFWAPIYLFIVVLMVQNFGKKGWVWLYYFFISFALGDLFTNRILKPLIHRTRPCIDGMWMDVHRHLVPNSHGYSFPSTHATNHFAISFFIIITCGQMHKSIKYIALLWAASVAYAQVYVGVHYPLDVIAGALLGSSIGYYTGMYFNLNKGLV
jgi:undecaprenyl-diphosphatase